jgi:hypothetical protein
MSGSAAGSGDRSDEASPRSKRTFTYTVDELKSRRHDGELATPAVFEYYVALQSYRRFVSRQPKSLLVQADLKVLQHRLNAICLQLTPFSFSRVFQEILSLGVTSDRLVLSFVNVVFKQAVLNPRFRCCLRCWRGASTSS